jgi:aquaporin Z
VNRPGRSIAEVLRIAADHRVEYAAEALGLGIFLVSACAFATLLWHPASPLHAALPGDAARRTVMGIAMGLTLVGLVHSPWGRRSGAHLNPAVTLAFWRLGRARGVDVAGYALAHFAGATAGVALAALLLGPALAHPAVHYVATRPGPAGAAVALVAELTIAFVLLGVVLRASDRPRVARWTGALAGAFLALAILVESPLSGTSMNPARTFGSALAARDWTAWWVYLLAPPLAMLAAVEAYRLELRVRRRERVGCAKFDHAPGVRCIFCEAVGGADTPAPGTSAAAASLEGGSRSHGTTSFHPSPKRGSPMQTKKLVIGVVAIAVLAGGWYAFRPERLWINQTVNESLDGAAMASATSAAGPRVLAGGTFHSGAHETKGTAQVLELEGGRRVLRLTDFHTSNGPDVQVYLVAADDVRDDATVKTAGFVHVAALKGNVGDQNYDLPADVDLAKYRSVTIWCRRFGVNFGTAPLGTGGTSIGAIDASSLPRVLASGMFHSGAHETAGMAQVIELEAGRRLLRLSGFHTSNGPDVQVYLVAADDVTDDATVKRAGFVRVAALKGNVGDQNYELPADVDLAKYRSVTIWCRRFGVNFGTAPLASVS